MEVRDNYNKAYCPWLDDSPTSLRSIDDHGHPQQRTIPKRMKKLIDEDLAAISGNGLSTRQRLKEKLRRKQEIEEKILQEAETTVSTVPLNTSQKSGKRKRHRKKVKKKSTELDKDDTECATTMKATKKNTGAADHKEFDVGLPKPADNDVVPDESSLTDADEAKEGEAMVVATENITDNKSFDESDAIEPDQIDDTLSYDNPLAKPVDKKIDSKKRLFSELYRIVSTSLHQMLRRKNTTVESVYDKMQLIENMKLEVNKVKIGMSLLPHKMLGKLQNLWIRSILSSTAAIQKMEANQLACGEMIKSRKNITATAGPDKRIVLLQNVIITNLLANIAPLLERKQSHAMASLVENSLKCFIANLYHMQMSNTEMIESCLDLSNTHVAEHSIVLKQNKINSFQFANIVKVFVMFLWYAMESCSELYVKDFLAGLFNIMRKLKDEVIYIKDDKAVTVENKPTYILRRYIFKSANITQTLRRSLIRAVASLTGNDVNHFIARLQKMTAKQTEMTIPYFDGGISFEIGRTIFSLQNEIISQPSINGKRLARTHICAMASVAEHHLKYVIAKLHHMMMGNTKEMKQSRLDRKTTPEAESIIVPNQTAQIAKTQTRIQSCANPSLSDISITGFLESLHMKMAHTERVAEHYLDSCNRVRGQQAIVLSQNKIVRPLSLNCAENLAKFQSCAMVSLTESSVKDFVNTLHHLMIQHREIESSFHQGRYVKFLGQKKTLYSSIKHLNSNISSMTLKTSSQKEHEIQAWKKNRNRKVSTWTSENAVPVPSSNGLQIQTKKIVFLRVVIKQLEVARLTAVILCHINNCFRQANLTIAAASHVMKQDMLLRRKLIVMPFMKKIIIFAFITHSSVIITEFEFRSGTFTVLCELKILAVTDRVIDGMLTVLSDVLFTAEMIHRYVIAVSTLTCTGRGFNGIRNHAVTGNINIRNKWGVDGRIENLLESVIMTKTGSEFIFGELAQLIRELILPAANRMLEQSPFRPETQHIGEFATNHITHFQNKLKIQNTRNAMTKYLHVNKWHKTPKVKEVRSRPRSFKSQIAKIMNRNSSKLTEKPESITFAATGKDEIQAKFTESLDFKKEKERKLPQKHFDAFSRSASEKVRLLEAKKVKDKSTMTIRDIDTEKANRLVKRMSVSRNHVDKEQRQYIGKVGNKPKERILDGSGRRERINFVLENTEKQTKQSQKEISLVFIEQKKLLTEKHKSQFAGKIGIKYLRKTAEIVTNKAKLKMNTHYVRNYIAMLHEMMKKITSFESKVRTETEKDINISTIQRNPQDRTNDSRGQSGTQTHGLLLEIDKRAQNTAPVDRPNNQISELVSREAQNNTDIQDNAELQRERNEQHEVLEMIDNLEQTHYGIRLCMFD